MGIRIGIVGAGTTVAIADRHVEGFLAQAGRCTVTAVCSRTCLLYTSPSPRDS